MSDGGALVAGVDGARGGWIAAIGSTHSFDPRPVFAPRFEALVAAWPGVVTWAIDSPLGLADGGDRECDALARRALGWPRCTSVFSVPAAAVLAASDYRAACDASLEACGKKLSLQAWNIVPKIREVRLALENCPDLSGRVIETHPELCFARLAGSAIVASKKTAEGIERRERALAATFGVSVTRSFVDRARSNRGVKGDDALDALAAWTTALRVARGEATSLPNAPPRDSLGLELAIVY
ncbi:MAG: DUF429 domain-containing protein [Lacipirellulaceae bacterium]